MKSLFTALASLALATTMYGHCQVPCGIYGDERKFGELFEDVETIAKSMSEITKLGDEETKNYNQIVRWVNNKELHAQKIQDAASEYFLAQRIKAETENYDKKLQLLHGIIVSAMKCKQTTDPENVATLKSTLEEFKELYLDHSH